MRTPARPRQALRVASALLILLAVGACSSPQQGVVIKFTTPDPLQGGHPHIYWADPTSDWYPGGDPITGTATIGGANLDGSGMSEAAITGVESPCGVAANGTHLFWANRRQDAIGRVKVDGSGLDNLFIRTAAKSFPCGVAVDDEYVYWANHGYGTRGTTIGRASLDGSSVDTGFIGGALNPCGVAVDGGYVYWANEAPASGSGGGTIGRARLDGSQVESDFILTDAVLPCGVAVDGSHVYWANSAGGAIGRARLDGSNVENAFIEGARWPCGVTVHGDYVYWGNAGAFMGPGPAAVGRARLDGTEPEHDWVTGMLGICGVAVEPATAS